MSSRSIPVNIHNINNNNSTPRSRNRTASNPKASASSPVISRTSSQSSQPRTSSRGDIPKPRMAPPASTTPRKPRPKQGVASSDQRRGKAVEQDDNVTSGVEGIVSGDAEIDLSSEDEELFGLLGVTSTPAAAKASKPAKADPAPIATQERGVLPISRQDIDKSKRSAKKKPTQSASKVAQPFHQDAQLPASPTPKSHTRNPRAGKPKQPHGSESESARINLSLENQPAPLDRNTSVNSKKAGNGRKGRNHQRKEDLAASGTFDVTSLSRSLPSEGFMAQAARLKKRTGKGAETTASEDEGTWDMPGQEDIAASGDLTWQQQLSSYPHVDGKTPSKRKPVKAKARGVHNPSLLSMTNPHSATSTPPNSFSHPTRPTHARRASADSIPSGKTRKSAPAAPVSASQAHGSTIENIPFHTGFNVHRAPQTPAKYATGVVSDLPLQGEFPRLKQGSLGPLGGMPIPSSAVGKIKYAGPTFHNSPHASSIPRPDTDDF